MTLLSFYSHSKQILLIKTECFSCRPEDGLPKRPGLTVTRLDGGLGSGGRGRGNGRGNGSVDQGSNQGIGRGIGGHGGGRGVREQEVGRHGGRGRGNNRGNGSEDHGSIGGGIGGHGGGRGTGEQEVGRNAGGREVSSEVEIIEDINRQSVVSTGNL